MSASSTAMEGGMNIPVEESPLSPGDLRELFESFNETTTRLQATHVTLQQEVTRLRRELADANDQIRRSRDLAALGEMAAGIAHEIRNPLGSIQLYVQMLADDLTDRAPQAELCQSISRAVTGLDAIVRDVLTFARDTTIRPAPVEAESLIQHALQSNAALLKQGMIEVVRDDADDTSIELHADHTLFVQALANVIRNAIEAMIENDSSPRRLKLSTTRRRPRCPDGRRADRIEFSISDTGPGIPDDVVKRIFNPFFTTRHTGTGLGLAIVHRIVDAHDGHIQVSNQPRGGASVQLFLPPRSAAVTDSDEPPIASIHTFSLPLDPSPLARKVAP